MTDETALKSAPNKMTPSQQRLATYGDRTGPGTSLRTVVGDASTFYAALPILVYVVLSEAGSKGVDDHDRVANIANRDNVPFEDAVGRFIDTLDLVAGIVFADGEERDLIAETITEIHRHVEGHLDDGSRYHAWNKDLWAWTWAGIIKPPIDAYQELHGPCDAEFLEDAYIGALQLGDLFGVRGLPDTYAEALKYWEQEWLPQARNTGTGQFLMSLAVKVPRPAVAPWIPLPVWNGMTWPLRNFLRTTVFMTFDPGILELLDAHPTRAERLSVAAHRMAWRILPDILTRNAFGMLVQLRLRYGNNSWNSHYSRKSLAEYHRQVEDARVQGLPQPSRPSKRH